MLFFRSFVVISSFLAIIPLTVTLCSMLLYLSQAYSVDTHFSRYEAQLMEEEKSFQQQRRRLYSELNEEKERLMTQLDLQKKEIEDREKLVKVSGFVEHGSFSGALVPACLSSCPSFFSLSLSLKMKARSRLHMHTRICVRLCAYTHTSMRYTASLSPCKLAVASFLSEVRFPPT